MKKALSVTLAVLKGKLLLTTPRFIIGSFMFSSTGTTLTFDDLLRLARTALCCFAFVMGFASLPCVAQEKSPQEQVRPRRVLSSEGQGEPDEVVRVDTDLVTVDATVTDATGQPVKNLRPEDFKLYEDGVERPIAFYNVEKRDGRLTRALERLSHEPNGLSTHTYDAVDDAVRLLVRQAPRTRERRLLKRAVIVVTDGFPVGDVVASNTVIERANAADVSVYTVTLPSFSRMLISTERQPLPTPLDVSGLAEQTGGKSVYATDKDFEPLFRALAEEVTSTYVLAFYPPEENRRDGRFHTIRVEAPRGLTIRQSRPGYKAEGRRQLN
ncbi:MAG: hypothetical protein DMF68_08440 [Acidobacteria bacterium]|nr:MAG: hypothetical protein DMF68_08440 [Acidobacteriota bacterium]